MYKQLEYSISSWVGIKRPFLLIGQPKIFRSSVRQKSSTAAGVRFLDVFITFNIFLIK